MIIITGRLFLARVPLLVVGVLQLSSEVEVCVSFWVFAELGILQGLMTLTFEGSWSSGAYSITNWNPYKYLKRYHFYEQRDYFYFYLVKRFFFVFFTWNRSYGFWKIIRILSLVKFCRTHVNHFMNLMRNLLAFRPLKFHPLPKIQALAVETSYTKCQKNFYADS